MVKMRLVTILIPAELPTCHNTAIQYRYCFFANLHLAHPKLVAPPVGEVE